MFFPWHKAKIRPVVRICHAVFIATICAVVPRISVADDKPLDGSYVAKSTTAFVADAASHTLQPLASVYIPAGTRFIAFDKVVSFDKSRRLILTENGLWAFIGDGDEYFWNTDRAEIFRQNKKLVIIRRPYEKSVDLGNGVQLQLTFTASEIYPFLRDSDDGPMISVGAAKIKNISPTITYEVALPSDNVSIFEPGTKLTLNLIPPFEEAVMNDVRGIKKPCDTQEVDTITAGGGGGIDLKAYFASLKLNADAESKKVTDFGPNINVTRLYYVRRPTSAVDSPSGFYIITKKQGCGSDQSQEYDVTTPDNNEILFNPKLAQDNKLVVDDATGQLLLRCPDDYFLVVKYLTERDFRPEEIAFMLSRAARIRKFSGTCSAQ